MKTPVPGLTIRYRKTENSEKEVYSSNDDTAQYIKHGMNHSAKRVKYRQIG